MAHSNTRRILVDQTNILLIPRNWCRGIKKDSSEKFYEVVYLSLYEVGYINSRGSEDKGSGVGSYRFNTFNSMIKIAPQYNINLNEISLDRKTQKVSKSFALGFRDYDILHFEPDLHWFPKQWFGKLLNIAPTKLIITIHGVSPLVYPEFTPKKQVLQRKFFLKPISSEIDGIITVSKSEKSLIVEHLEVPESKVFVTYNGNTMLEVAGAGVEKKESLPKFDRYILHVSNARNSFWRKRPKLLLESFREFTKKVDGVNLLIIGRGWEGKNIHSLINKFGLEDNVKTLGQVEPERLVKFYKNALLYLQTSLYESFCLPIVEAMTFGTPVVSTRAYAVPEIAKGGAVYVESDPKQIADALEGLLQDEDLYKEKAKQAKKIAKSYTWERTARETLEAYREVIHN